MVVRLLQRDYVISESPRLVTLLCILLQHSTVLVGLSLVVTSVFSKYVGITTDTIIGVAGSLIASRYIGFIGRDIDITETRASRQEEIA
jgi:short subunit fatty acids transporter